MKLTVFNGSPRGKGGNTEILLDWFTEGFASVAGNSSERAYLLQIREHDRFAEMFRDAEAVFLAFPLYTDAMPGIVKAFIERLAPLQAREANAPVLFMVQSGFPEAERSRPVERYLRKLAARLHSPYVGAIVRGNCEGIHLMPPLLTKRVRQAIRQLGAGYGRTGTLHPDALKRFAGPERLSLSGRGLFHLMDLVGLTKAYWNGNLKKHGAYARRFARPYEGLW